MKRLTFALLFVATQVTIIFLEIHKHTRFIKYSFAKQKLERQQHSLAQQQELLTQELYALQNANNIQEFAEKTLLLKPINLTQIKRLQ